jgi:hypothetical protein
MSRRSPDNSDHLDQWERAAEQQRRVRVFNYLIQRRDLVSFAEIAREPVMGARGLEVLIDSAIRGEFGERLYCMPSHVPTYRPFWIRRSPLGVAQMRQTMPDDLLGLWLPRRRAAQWLQGRRIQPPLWLHPEHEPKNAPVVEEEPEPPKPPFDYGAAKALLVGLKVGKQLQCRPSDQEAMAILGRHFSGVTRDPVRKLIKDIWGAGKRGPRPSRPAKSAK